MKKRKKITKPASVGPVTTSSSDQTLTDQMQSQSEVTTQPLREEPSNNNNNLMEPTHQEFSAPEKNVPENYPFEFGSNFQV